MYCAILGSSSAGNSTAIWGHSSTILVDCGLAPRLIAARLHSIDPRIPPISGILITHIHGDHINPQALKHFLQKGIPVLLPRKIAKLLERRFDFFRTARDRNLVRESSGAGVMTGEFEIRSFPVPHDSPGGCYGYVVRGGAGSRRRSIAIATDFGYPPDGLQEIFADKDVFIIESNHDSRMLEDSNRSQSLKQRIREVGHLSNSQCAEFVVSACRSSLRPPGAVILAHISQECNTPGLAIDCTRAALREGGFPDVDLSAAFPNRVSRIIEV